MAKGKMAAPPLRLGARAATYKPGFSPKPRKPYRVLCLTLDINVNEFITRQQGNLLGTETEKTCRETPPGYTTKQDLHVLNEVILKNLRNWGDVNGKYQLFVQKTKDGPLHPYQTREQIKAAEDQMVRNLVARVKRKEARS